MSQASAHEPGPHIFEGKGRAMEEFEAGDVGRDRYEGDIEIQGLMYDPSEICFGDAVTYIWVHDPPGHLIFVHGFKRVQKRIVPARDLHREIQSFVRCLTLNGGCPEVYNGRGAPQASVLHLSVIFVYAFPLVLFQYAHTIRVDAGHMYAVFNADPGVYILHDTGHAMGFFLIAVEHEDGGAAA